MTTFDKNFESSPYLMFSDRSAQYEELEKLRNSKLLVFITGDRPGFETQISPQAETFFVNHLDKFNKPDKISLYLYTRGGDTLAAWGLVNLLKQFCNELEVIVPSKARSAGSLICLGAKTIVMTKQATLGPIDPSLNSPLNPQNPQIPQNPAARVPVSVESINGYFGFLKQEGVTSEQHLSQAFINLTTHVHPLVLGNVFRSRLQIQMLAKKLLSAEIADDEKINKIISFLCSDSGSHDYPIYRREARNDLGLNIESPDDHLYSVIKDIYDDIEREMELNVPFDPAVLLANQPTADYQSRRTLIESIVGGTDALVTEGTLSKTVVQVQQAPGFPPIQQVSIQDQRKFEGWRHETH